jgi:DNA-binding PucR family transcriptional regulator
MTGVQGSCALVGVIDGDVVGLVSTRPVAADVGFPVGVGGPASLDAVQGAFATASRVHDVARSLGLTGVVHLADLGIKVAVASEPVLGELMVERTLAPLHRDGEFGEAITRTLEAYLGCGGRIKSTAHRLGVHPNTVRHRLARFEELTGRRVDDIEVMIEVWWALWWQRCHRPGGGPGGG